MALGEVDGSTYAVFAPEGKLNMVTALLPKDGSTALLGPHATVTEALHDE